VRLLRGGQHVLDLGASPGSWAKYIAQKIGQSGRLLAVDLKPMTISLPPGSVFILGDALSLENEALQTFAPYDVVVSDMAPSTSGTRSQDQARSYELFMRAVEVATGLTKPGGSFVGKIFMGEDFPYARKKIKECYEEDKVIRPEGTRTNSYEVFLIGLGRKPQPT
jgi:23S rRNA (uridine2552-2'-O)-methyltransferase